MLKEDIVRKYTNEKGLAIANLVLELEERILALEEAMAFFSEWYNKTQRGPEILIPNHLKDN